MKWFLIVAGLMALLCHDGAAASLTVACGSATDAGYTGGYAWTAVNQSTLAALAPPYNALRASNGAAFSYTLTDLPFGPYWITVAFVEPNKTAAGQRLFSVSVNGSVVLPAVDIFALAGGALKPLEIVLPGKYISPLTITLTPIKGNAVVSAITVESVP